MQLAPWPLADIPAASWLPAFATLGLTRLELRSTTPDRRRSRLFDLLPTIAYSSSVFAYGLSDAGASSVVAHKRVTRSTSLSSFSWTFPRFCANAPACFSSIGCCPRLLGARATCRAASVSSSKGG